MVLILSCLDLLRTVHVSSVVVCCGLCHVPIYLDRASVINIVFLCVLYLHLKDTSPAPSRLLRARPVVLGKLLKTTGIQIATNRYATLQAMAPTNVKTVHQTSLFHIESNLVRLGLLSPTHGQRSQQQSGQTMLQSVLINKSKFLKATHRAKIRKIKTPRSMVVKTLSW